MTTIPSLTAIALLRALDYLGQMRTLLNIAREQARAGGLTGQRFEDQYREMGETISDLQVSIDAFRQEGK